MGVGSTRGIFGRDWCTNERKHKEQDSYRWSTRIRKAAGATGEYKRSERPMDLNIQQLSRQERRRRRLHELPLRRAFGVPQIGEMRLRSLSQRCLLSTPARGARLPPPRSVLDRTRVLCKECP